MSEERPEEEEVPTATGGDEIEDDTALGAITSALTETVTDAAAGVVEAGGEAVAGTLASVGADESAQAVAESTASVSSSLDSMGETPPSEAEQAGENTIEDLQEREQARSFQEQCYLLYNWRKFAAFNHDAAYRRFVKVHDGGNSPSEMLNAMTAVAAVAQAVEELPALYSSLVPKIRIYKSYQPTADLNAESVDVEVKFDNFTSDLHDLMVLPAHGRGQGAGIMSFEFKNSGNMPGAAVRSLEATLSLHLNSLLDLEVVRAHPRDSVTATEASLALLENAEPVRIIDLFTASSSLVPGTDEHNPNHYRIKAIVGWETPRQISTGDQDALEALREFVERTSHTFFLELTTHELDLKEDGTVSVSISYIATLENALRSAQPGDSDVLFGTLPRRVQSEVARERQAIRTQRESMQEQVSQRGCDAQERARLSGRNDEAQAEAAQSAREDADSDNEEREEALQARENRQRMALYQNFLESLIELHGLRYIDVEGEELGVVSRRLSLSDYGSVGLRTAMSLDQAGRTAAISAGETAIGQFAAIGEGAQEDLERRSQGQLTADEAARRRSSRGSDMSITSRIKTIRFDLEHRGDAGNLSAYSGRGSFTTSITATGDDDDPSVNTQALQGIRASIRSSEDAQIQERTAREAASTNGGSAGFATSGRNTELWRSIWGANSGNIEALSASLVQGTQVARVEPGKYRVFFVYLGDIIDAALGFIESESTRKELRQMRTLVGPTEFIDPTTPELTRNYVNLADVPISWTQLQKWFGRDIVAADVLQISFSEFLTKVTRSLLREAFGPRCFERDMDGAVATSAVITTNMFQLNTQIDPFTETVPPYPYGGGVVNFSPSQFAQDRFSPGATSNYLFIFGQMRDPNSLIFDPTIHPGTRRSRDASKGIYHLRHGSATGIVKRITFKRKDDPQLRSANIARAAQSDSGANRFRILRERYDADVSMLGNGLFKPGDYVYVDPSFWTGQSGPGNIVSSNSRFKGYYSVLESRSVIESGKYETEISCVYQADGETSEDYSGTRPRSTPEHSCENTSPQSIGQDSAVSSIPSPPSVSSAAGSQETS